MSYRKKPFAVVCFGDIRGFCNWELNITDPDKEFSPLLLKWEKIINDFSRETNYYVKTLADGVMVVMEIDGKDRSTKVARFLNQIWDLTMKTLNVIQGTSWPRPDGFRTRIACGHVWRNNSLRGRDYIGRHINMANKLLQVAPEIPVVCHEGIRELLNEKQIERENFSFSRFDFKARRLSDKIANYDLRALLKFEKVTDYASLGRARKKRV